ncbi:MAG: serine peptidase, partial [Bradyrhizobium sp.]|nr:serine peptidase [Bradyrhizobium sp.]
MQDQVNTANAATRAILKPRRLALLGSVAALGIAVLAIGPGGTAPFSLPAWTASAHAAEAPNTAGFADLVAKVKPAVISVRVKIDSDTDTPAVTQRDDDNGMNSEQGSPLEQFYRQFGFRLPQAMPHSRQVITGEGSGFFISP